MYCLCRTGRCDAASNGFLSEDELETAAANGEGTTLQNDVQFLFPAINFNGSVNITEWTFVADNATMNRNVMNAALPQLQVWRPSPFVKNSFSLQSSTGSMSELRGTEPLYRYVPATPISVMPGDVLGIYIPRIPLLLLRFRDVGEGNTPMLFFLPANGQLEIFSITHAQIKSQYIPFVYAELGESIYLCTSHELVSSLKDPDVTMSSTSTLEISLSTFQFSTIQSASMVETGSLGIHEDLSTTVWTTFQPLTIQGSPSLITIYPLYVRYH